MVSWLREEKYYKIIAEEFNSPTAEKYFNTNYLMEILDVHKSGKENYSRKI